MWAGEWRADPNFPASKRRVFGGIFLAVRAKEPGQSIVGVGLRWRALRHLGDVLGAKQKMTCIRNPWWDGTWVLSGLPLGLALTLLIGWIPAFTVLLWVILVTQTGHTLAPLVLAWSHRGFRERMLDEGVFYIAVPVTVLILSALIGYNYGGEIHFDPQSFALASGPQSFADLQNPFFAMLALYAVWNAWHFGRQAFGVMSIYRRKIGGGSRWVDLWYCCAVIWAAMGMVFVPQLARLMHNILGWPAHPHPFLDNVRLGYFVAAAALPAAMLLHEWLTMRSLARSVFIVTDGVVLGLIFHVGLWGMAIIGLNHWLVAIGLASHFHNRRNPWPFVFSVCALGFVLFTLLFFNLSSIWEHGFTAAALSFTATAVAFRLGLGFVHFMYDRKLYQKESPIWYPISRDATKGLPSAQTASSIAS